MRVVYKYVLELVGSQIIELPTKAMILSVQLQGTSLCLWALIDTDYSIERRTILIAGTGHDIGASGVAYISTVQLDNGLVFHIFEDVSHANSI